jgi:hypothetical protein
MKSHLALDAVSGGMLLAAAALLDDEEPDQRALLAGIGLFEIGAALMTTTSPRNSVPIHRSSGDPATRLDRLLP